MGEFPKYLMVVDGKQKFLSFHEASVAYDSGWARVEFGHLVLESDFSVRDMTDAERAKLSEAADEYGASK